LELIIFSAIDEDDSNHQEQIGELIKQTAASIDDLALKMLFVTIQQNNLEVCIEYAVNRSVVDLCRLHYCFNLFLFQVYLQEYPNSGTYSMELQRYKHLNEQRGT